MNKKVILFALVGIIITVLLFFGLGAVIASRVPEYATHYHANFAVFENGNVVNFSQPSLMHLKPCKEDDDPGLHPKLDNIHLHDMVGNVVHVHDDGLTWSDLFTSIKYNLTEVSQKNNVLIYYYLNGARTDDSILSKIISKNDRLLITMTADSLPETVDGNPLLQSQMNKVGSDAGDYDNKSTESCSGNKARSWQSRLRIGLNGIFFK